MPQKWEAVETYTPHDPVGQRRRETIVVEVDTTDPLELAAHVFVALHGGTIDEAKAELRADLEDDLGYQDNPLLADPPGLAFAHFGTGGDYEVDVNPAKDGPQERLVRVTLTYRLRGETRGLDELRDHYGQQVEVTLRDAGLAEGLIGVESEVS